jgi:hypothetical protein
VTTRDVEPAFGPQAALAATLPKGAHVQIEGDLRTRQYTEKAPGK